MKSPFDHRFPEFERVLEIIQPKLHIPLMKKYKFLINYLKKFQSIQSFIPFKTKERKKGKNSKIPYFVYGKKYHLERSSSCML